MTGASQNISDDHGVNKGSEVLPRVSFLRKMKQALGRLIIPRLPVRRVVFKHLRWELNARWIRVLNGLSLRHFLRIRRLRRRRGLSVNIGCGPFGIGGWVNLDLMKHRCLTFRYDCRKGIPLEKNSAARIRCEHFFEHLDYREEVPCFLKNCYDCLQEGGILRIVVPDAGRFLLAYAQNDKNYWKALGWDLDNLPVDFFTRMDIINHVFRQGEEHLYAYDYETLERILRQAGFREVRKSGFGMSSDPLLANDLPNHKPYSLYIEAVKQNKTSSANPSKSEG